MILYRTITRAMSDTLPFAFLYSYMLFLASSRDFARRERERVFHALETFDLYFCKCESEILFYELLGTIGDQLE
jgi:hypothetical protein